MSRKLVVLSSVALSDVLVRQIEGAGASVIITSEPLRSAVAETRPDCLIVSLTEKVDEEIFELPNSRLRLVANVAAGFDNIDINAANRHGVSVTNTPDVLSCATAELTMGLMLDIARRISEGDRYIRSGASWGWRFDFMLGTGLREKTLGIIGYGRIGREVARLAKAFGMKVQASHSKSGEASARSEVPRLPLEELFATSDVISIHAPLMPETMHLVNAERLQIMKRTAFIINTARGPIIDEDALVHALKTGEIAGAGLDVFENEPEVHSGLLSLDNVALVPHLGSATVETREAMAELASRNVMAFIKGDPLITLVRI